MKTKIVLWGTNAKDEKVLLAVDLLEETNSVQILIFKEEVATELFYNQMMNQWREGQPVPLPDHDTIVRPLTMTENLLPDDLRTTRTDILNRAKTEWHFVVLSSKLFRSYADEIQEFKDRVEQLSQFDSGIWEEMKSFWQKVQSQVREKNLYRHHASELRDKTNALFDNLKSLKKALDAEFEELSSTHLNTFKEKLQDIEDRVEKGLGLQPIFNELKDIQRSFRDTNFTRRHRNEVWKKLDGLFKLVKEKKYGNKDGGGTALSRINRRYQGLLAAIKKMESSIVRDKKEKEFQQSRIDDTDGQLELQIRQAKMAMIEERIQSKEKKLAEMLQTKQELEKRTEIEEKRQSKKKAKPTEEDKKGDEEKSEKKETQSASPSSEVQESVVADDNSAGEKSDSVEKEPSNTVAEDSKEEE